MPTIVPGFNLLFVFEGFCGMLFRFVDTLLTANLVGDIFIFFGVGSSSANVTICEGSVCFFKDLYVGHVGHVGHVGQVCFLHSYCCSSSTHVLFI